MGGLKKNYIGGVDMAKGCDTKVKIGILRKDGVIEYKQMKVNDAPVNNFVVDSGVCIECEWDGLLKDAEIEYEWDEFKGNDIPYPTCPECGGGIDDYYQSKIVN